MPIAGGVAAFAVLAFALSFFIDEPLRRYMERSLNAELKGYTARVLALEFHPLGFSITLHDVTVIQDAHPKPPVAWFPQFDASVHWRALLRARLVADFLFQRPHLYINLAQLRAEKVDRVPLKDKGWQAALEAIYPLKVNRLRVEDGDLLYIDNDPKRPLYVHEVEFAAENIRNVRSADRVYPSEVHAAGIVFQSGKLRIDGHANFLAEPYAGVDADIGLERIDLSYFKPIVERMNLRMNGGSLSTQGHVEYAPDVKKVRLKEVTIRDAQVDYVHTAATAIREQARVEQVRRAADRLSHTRAAVMRIDQLHIADSTVGYIDQSSSPEYRVFLEHSELTMENLSNQAREGRAFMALTGEFMGNGNSYARATFMPAAKTPDVDIAVMIEGTQLTSMNDLLRRLGGFDVVAGQFSVYSELTIKDGELSGYLKPIFQDMNVYSPPQDGKKPLLHQLYEALVGGTQTVLQNRHREVGAKVDISGRASAPKTSTWEIVGGLLKNAFLKAIGHGFEPPG